MTHRLFAPPLPVWLEAMVPFERYRVDIGGRAMHVMETGAGRPVVMVHGNPTWGFLYRKVAAELASSPYRVLMPDLIGFGSSDKPERPDDHALDDHIAWFGRWLDEMELDDVVLVVQDWGGAIGVGAMADRADRLAGLVVLNTVLGPPRPGFSPTLFHRSARWPVVSDLLFRKLDFPQRILWFSQGDKRSIRGAVSDAYRFPLRENNAGALGLTRMVPDSMDHPSIPALTRVGEFIDGYTGTAAIVWGDRDPVLGRLRNRTSRQLPQAPVTRTDAGHFLQEEVPEEIADAVRFVRG